MVNKRSNNNEDNNTSVFLRAEFERISELFLENEKFGENRVNFLISLISAITAILTGIGVLEAFGGKSDTSPNITNISISWFESMFRTGTSNTSLHTIPITLLSIFLYALIAYGILFLFGFVTLKRILVRNDNGDRYKRQLNQLRLYFINQDPSILNYIPYIPWIDKIESRIRAESWPFRFYKAGWLETVQLLNNVLGALIVSIISFITLTYFNHSVVVVILTAFCAAAGFFGIWSLQIIYSNSYFKSVKKKGMKNDFNSNPIDTLDDEEQEASLIICSQNPEAVYRLIAILPSIETRTGNYELRHEEDEKILDQYFDAKDGNGNGILDKKKHTLRIRKTETKDEKTHYSINLKQPSTKHSQGIDNRPEWEHRWTRESLKDINSILKRVGELLHRKIELTDKDIQKDPIEIMKKLDLEDSFNTERLKGW